jgi:hypothetical protein
MKKQYQDNPDYLGTRKTRAVQALLQYSTKEKAAQEAGVSVVTPPNTPANVNESLSVCSEPLWKLS